MRLLIALLLVGCGGAADGRGLVSRVRLDEWTYPEKMDLAGGRAALEDAVAFWAGCGFDIAIDEAHGKPIVFDGSLSAEKAIGEVEPTVILLSTRTSYVLDGEPCEGQVNLGDIMRHELGHTVGLGHDPETWSVMFAPMFACVSRYEAVACHAP